MTTGNRPRPLSDLVPGLTKGIFGKKNLLFGKLVAQWTYIAGPEISARATPVDLKFQRGAKGMENTAAGKANAAAQKTNTAAQQAILHLAVQPAFALEFSYQKNLLIERLNVFFGYPAIRDIKIIQNSEIMNKTPAAGPKTKPLTLQDQQKIEALTAGIQENDLQTALKNLGKAIASRRD